MAAADCWLMARVRVEAEELFAGEAGGFDDAVRDEGEAGSGGEGKGGFVVDDVRGEAEGEAG